MFIIEKPYASEFLIDTIVQNDWPVLDNESVRNAAFEEGALDIIPSDQARDYYLTQEYPLIYSNSENAISWVLENLPNSNLASYINFFKDKFAFRELLHDIYPEFYFETVEFDALKSVNARTLKYPFIIKPSVGFLSLGVHPVREQDDWKDVLSNITKEMKNAESLYPKSVISSSKFIMEEMIEGEEYAIDAYYDRNGDPVILNIFRHPFLNDRDVSDRMYLMSTEIMIKYMAKFALLLRQIGEMKDIRNFPLHMEVRVTKDEVIIPIEINPMRFAGWCTTDVAKYAWGINVYEYFYYQKRPDWTNILSNTSRKMFYFSMAEVPVGTDRSTINKFDYDSFLSNYSNVLEVRRINHQNNPLFAIVFGSTDSMEEVEKILSLKTSIYID